MSQHECRIYLAFSGADFNPEELTDYLGIKPTRIKRKGRQSDGAIYRKTVWEYSSENVIGACVDVYEISSNLVKTLYSHRTKLIEVPNKFAVSVQFTVVLYVSDDDEISVPSIGFDTETVSFVSELGANIDVDMYLVNLNKS